MSPEFSRRQFNKTALALPLIGTAMPITGLLSHPDEFNELFFNCSPSHQVLTVEISMVLSRVTGFDFTPKVVGMSEGRHLVQALRRRSSRIQDEAKALLGCWPYESDRLALAWLAGEGAPQRTCWLAAFVRAGSFRIERTGRTGRFIFLSVEV